jgi:2-keto-3-deoxy-6-phosphogluconate aldolase
MHNLKHFLSPLPLVAVLRGITPNEAVPIADILYDAGFRIIEVPLNSPQPFDSIEAITKRHGNDSLVGAGTVLTIADVARVRNAGGQLIVMPHSDVTVIREAKRLHMICAPGIATPTEGFAALAAGADGLKLFPAEMLARSDQSVARGVSEGHDHASRRRYHARSDGGFLARGRKRFWTGLGALSPRHDAGCGARAGVAFPRLGDFVTERSNLKT